MNILYNFIRKLIFQIKNKEILKKMLGKIDLDFHLCIQTIMLFESN